MPDMAVKDVDLFRRQLDETTEYITIKNASSVLFTFPRRILARAGCGARTFWEVECSDLNPKE